MKTYLAVKTFLILILILNRGESIVQHIRWRRKPRSISLLTDSSPGGGVGDVYPSLWTSTFRSCHCLCCGSHTDLYVLPSRQSYETNNTFIQAITLRMYEEICWNMQKMRWCFFFCLSLIRLQCVDRNNKIIIMYLHDGWHSFIADWTYDSSRTN